MKDAIDAGAAGSADIRSVARELAHALTNQFGVIRNYAELAAEDADDPRSLREDLAEIQDAAQRGVELTGRLNALGERVAGS